MSVAVARPLPRRRGGAHRQALVQVAHMRLMMLMLLFAAAVLVVVGRLATLALFSANGDGRGALGAAPRGDITDRNGAPLARTIDSYAIGVHPGALLGDPAQIADKLAAIMPDHGRAFFYALLTKKVNFTYLARRASPALVEAVNAIGEPAIIYEHDQQRLYPQSTLAAHALGFLSVEGKGMSGMERVLDGRLTSPATAADPVALSLDLRVQAAMESELARAKGTFQARAAAGVVRDTRTG